MGEVRWSHRVLRLMQSGKVTVDSPERKQPRFMSGNDAPRFAYAAATGDARRPNREWLGVSVAVETSRRHAVFGEERARELSATGAHPEAQLSVVVESLDRRVVTHVRA